MAVTSKPAATSAAAMGVPKLPLAWRLLLVNEVGFGWVEWTGQTYAEYGDFMDAHDASVSMYKSVYM